MGNRNYKQTAAKRILKLGNRVKEIKEVKIIHKTMFCEGQVVFKR